MPDFETIFKELSKCKKLLTPLIGSLAAALGMYVASQQTSYATENDTKMAVMEHRVTEIEKIREDVKSLSNEVHELIGEIRNGRNRCGR